MYFSITTLEGQINVTLTLKVKTAWWNHFLFFFGKKSFARQEKKNRVNIVLSPALTTQCGQVQQVADLLNFRGSAHLN